MDDLTMQREIRAEVERRMTGGPDAVPAWELARGDTRPEPEDAAIPAVEALWESWLGLSVQLQGLGFTQRTLCDAQNTITEVREETIRERTGTTS